MLLFMPACLLEVTSGSGSDGATASQLVRALTAIVEAVSASHGGQSRTPALPQPSGLQMHSSWMTLASAFVNGTSAVPGSPACTSEQSWQV